jgi:hypothetical protein
MFHGIILYLVKNNPRHGKDFSLKKFDKTEKYTKV